MISFTFPFSLKTCRRFNQVFNRILKLDGKQVFNKNEIEQCSGARHLIEKAISSFQKRTTIVQHFIQGSIKHKNVSIHLKKPYFHKETEQKVGYNSCSNPTINDHHDYFIFQTKQISWNCLLLITSISPSYCVVFPLKVQVT